MKNTLHTTLILLGLMLLCACSSNDRQLRIGVSQCSNDAWRRQMNSEMLREASFHHGNIIVDIRMAGDNNGRQER